MLPDGWVLDNEFGAVTRVWDGQGDEEFVLETKQHFGHTLDLNREEIDYNSDFKRYREGLGEHAARIPIVIVHDLKKRGIWDDPERFLEWLDDPENEVFRTNKMALTKGGMKRKGYGT